MPRLLLALAILLAALLQAAVLPQLILLQARPNLVLVLILLWTIARGAREGALWAFGAGLFLDLITLAPLGSHALALLGVTVVGAFNRTPRFRIGLLLPMLAALGATFVHDAILLLLGGAGLSTVTTLLRLSLLTSLINLATVPVMSLLTERLHRWVALQEETLGRPQPPGASTRRSRRRA